MGRVITGDSLADVSTEELQELYDDAAGDVRSVARQVQVNRVPIR